MDPQHINKSMSSWWLIKLNNEFVFPDSEPPIINMLYVWSGICGQFKLCYFIFSFTTLLKLIIFVFFYYAVNLISSFSVTRSLLVPYTYVSIKSIDCFFYHHLKLNQLIDFFSKNIMPFTFKSLLCIQYQFIVFMNPLRIH